MEVRRVKELEPDRMMAHRFGTRSKVSNLERKRRERWREYWKWKALRQIHKIRRKIFIGIVRDELSFD